MKKAFFGTDGIRGKTNGKLINEKFLRKLSFALTIFFKNSINNNKKIIIGKDTRRSCYMIESSITSVFLSCGWECESVGVIPTPAISTLIKKEKFDFGIMISASHNSYLDNGLKIFNGKGEKLSDYDELKIEEILKKTNKQYLCQPENIGIIIRNDLTKNKYENYLLSTIPKNIKFDNLKLVVDCANGSAYKIAPNVFKKLGINLVADSVLPDGKNINKKCGALHPKRLSRIVKINKADIGVSFDGDADRLILCDKNGKIIDGDKILGIAAVSLLKQKKLNKKAIVSTKMANIGLKDYLNLHGIKLILTDVGDRYVMSEMKNKKINLGGEQSGHLIFSDHSFTGDGILSLLQILYISKIEKKPIHELVEDFVKFPQILVNMELKKNPEKVLQSFLLKSIIKDLTFNKKDDLQILIRKSGTENLLRLMVQSRSKVLTKNVTKSLKQTIELIDEK